MSLAQWRRDALGDAPDGVKVQRDGRYTLAMPCRQDEPVGEGWTTHPPEVILWSTLDEDGEPIHLVGRWHE